MKVSHSIFILQNIAFINHGGLTTVAKDLILFLFTKFLSRVLLNFFTFMVIYCYLYGCYRILRQFILALLIYLSFWNLLECEESKLPVTRWYCSGFSSLTAGILNGPHSQVSTFRNTRLCVHNPVGKAVIWYNSTYTRLSLSELSLHYPYSVHLYGKSFLFAYYGSLFY